MNMALEIMFLPEVIIAHGPGCNDGATAAWAFWRKMEPAYKQLLAQEGGFYSANNEHYKVHPNSCEGALLLQKKGFPTVFVFVQPNTNVPDELVRDKNVLILDLDMGDALIPVVETAKAVILSDHHESTMLGIQKHAKFLLEDNKDKFGMFVVTEKSESGATLAWKLAGSGDIPPLVQVVRIGDTWCWDEYKELHAREVLASLKIYNGFQSFEHIEDVHNTWDEMHATYIAEGRVILEHELFLMRSVARQCTLGYIKLEDKVYTIAYVQANMLAPEVAVSMRSYAQNRFKTHIDFCLVWKYIPQHDLFRCSIRSPFGDLNLAHIARNIPDGKGGGHKEAAGFSIYGYDNFHKVILKSDPRDTNLVPTEKGECVIQL